MQKLFFFHPNKIRLLALASVAALTVSACAADLPSGAADETTQAFALLADESAVGNAAPGEGNAKKRHFRGGHHGFFFGMMARELNLTSEQKTQFQALMKPDAQQQAVTAEMKAEMKALKAQVKTEFLSEQFDVAALQSAWDAIQKPDADAVRLKMAEKLHTAWHILTPAQQTQLEAKLVALEARFAEKAQTPSDKQKGHAEKMLARMTQQLGLSEAQQNTLKSRWEAQHGERQDRRAAMKAVKQTVLQQLKSGASAASIAQSLSPLGEHIGKSGHFLNRLATLHDILTPDQRQKLIETMAQHQGKHKGKFRRGHKAS